jgi:hypothetical protein
MRGVRASGSADDPARVCGAVWARKTPAEKRASARKYKNPERIPGGLASGMKPSDFDQRALARGTKVELEHTRSEKIAREIAMDHLTEDPHYYEKLARVENPMVDIWNRFRVR